MYMEKISISVYYLTIEDIVQLYTPQNEVIDVITERSKLVYIENKFNSLKCKCDQDYSCGICLK